MIAINKFLKLIAILGILPISSPSKSAEHISSEDAYTAALTNRAILVDVREKAEIVETGIADLAVWLPTSSIETRGPAFNEAVKSWPKEQKLIFYCRSGRRSEKAADFFSTLGYRTYNAGSMTNWKDAGLPVKDFPAAK